MKERPIIFNAPMIRSILEGRKTQTRGAVKPQPPCSLSQVENSIMWTYTLCDKEWKCPYGKPGDRLWVRETWATDLAYNPYSPSQIDSGSALLWYADGKTRGVPPFRWGKTRPSIHMPRWASRITLEITEIRVERLQDISEEDARAEGVRPFPRDLGGDCWTDGKHTSAFEFLWNEIHGWAPNAWGLNPWVWVISFKRVQQ